MPPLAMPPEHADDAGPRMNEVIDFPVRPELAPYLDAFTRPAGEPHWLTQHRERNLHRFARLGFPNRRSEAWRYIDLRRLEEKPLLPAQGDAGVGKAAAERLDTVGLPGPVHRLVLRDGTFVAELSDLRELPQGLRLLPLARAIADCPDLLRAWFDTDPAGSTQPFAALNAALFTDGFVLDLAPGTILDRPIEIVRLSDGEGSRHTRGFVTLGAGSRATLVETHAGSGGYWANDHVAMRLETGAALGHAVLVEEGVQSVHLGELAVSLGDDAHFDSAFLVLGGRTVRHEVTIAGEGDRTRCAIDGAFVIGGRQEANIVTVVDHRGCHGETQERVKGVAAGRAHGAFQGRIIVRPDAQQTDAHLVSRNLILGEQAVIDTKPELEIDADDVKCSHGAAIGDLDETALFYLMTRGIPYGEARRMLIDAFVREAVERVAVPELRAHLLARLSHRLAQLED
jgi:Fe-S cluster assembly protein SufD